MHLRATTRRNLRAVSVCVSTRQHHAAALCAVILRATSLSVQSRSAAQAKVNSRTRSAKMSKAKNPEPLAVEASQALPANVGLVASRVATRAEAQAKCSGKRSKCLTLRSSGHATACHAGPSFHSEPCASCRSAPLSSNVRPHGRTTSNFNHEAFQARSYSHGRAPGSGGGARTSSCLAASQLPALSPQGIAELHEREGLDLLSKVRVAPYPRRSVGVSSCLWHCVEHLLDQRRLPRVLSQVASHSMSRVPTILTA